MLKPTKRKYLVYSLTVILFVAIIPFISNCTHREDQFSSNYIYTNEFVTFDRFILNTERATFDDFSKKDITKVSNNREFKKMQKHILTLYEGVKVNNSFVMDSGVHVDCIDIQTQPGLRQNGELRKLATPPPPLKIDIKEDDQKAKFIEPMLSKDKKDHYGNVMYCPEGYIPMRRIMLEELTRYKTLNDFFNKYGKTGKTGSPLAEQF